jgi:hypothetical protein
MERLMMVNSLMLTAIKDDTKQHLYVVYKQSLVFSWGQIGKSSYSWGIF